MRKQYHFRPSPNGYYAWDVDRLIELSKEIIPQEIALCEIAEFDENYWYADKNDTPSCRSITEHFGLMQETDLAYPIILTSDGRLMDGMHRVCKAHFLGHTTIKAVRFAIDPAPDYVDVHPDDLSYDEGQSE